MPRDTPRSPYVRKSEADEVYFATATEKLRTHKAKKAHQLHPMESFRNEKEANEIVDNAQRDQASGKKKRR